MHLRPPNLKNLFPPTLKKVPQPMLQSIVLVNLERLFLRFWKHCWKRVCGSLTNSLHLIFCYSRYSQPYHALVHYQH